MQSIRLNVTRSLLVKTVVHSRPIPLHAQFSHNSNISNKHTFYTAQKSIHRITQPSLLRHRHLITTCASTDNTPGPDALRAVEGDIVSIHWTCMDEEGNVLESSRDKNEVATFEVGAGNFVGNQLFEAFDEAIRGIAVGESIGIKVQGTPWERDLLFTVPRAHEEIQRLEGRYKNQGGVQEGQLVELSNGGMALIIKCDENEVVLDANSMLAGKTLLFELELIDLERQ